MKWRNVDRATSELVYATVWDLLCSLEKFDKKEAKTVYERERTIKGNLVKIVAVRRHGGAIVRMSTANDDGLFAWKKQYYYHEPIRSGQVSYESISRFRRRLFEKQGGKHGSH